MRILFAVFLFCLGCSQKIGTTTPSRSKTDQQLTRIVKTDSGVQTLSTYSTQAEAVFGILWPLKFNQDSRKLLGDALDQAKQLQKIRKSYSEESQSLKKQSAENFCECVVSGLCETEIADEKRPQYEQECSAIEAKQIKNDETLADLLSRQERLKSKVLAVGGHWLKADQMSFDPIANTLEFMNGAFVNSQSEKIEANPKEIYWKFDALKISGAIQIQGEIKIVHDSTVYIGEMGFQLPERGD